MTSKISSSDIISDRYGSALYDLASEKKCIDEILNDLDVIEKVMKESSELRHVIKSPLVNSEEKLNILLKIFAGLSFNNLTTTFLKVLDNNKRIANISSIILQFKKINSEKRGDIAANVTSANELSEDEKNNITNQLKNTLGQKLSFIIFSTVSKSFSISSIHFFSDARSYKADPYLSDIISPEDILDVIDQFHKKI